MCASDAKAPPAARTQFRPRRGALFLPVFRSHRNLAVLSVAGNRVLVNFRHIKLTKRIDIVQLLDLFECVSAFGFEIVVLGVFDLDDYTDPRSLVRDQYVAIPLAGFAVLWYPKINPPSLQTIVNVV